LLRSLIAIRNYRDIREEYQRARQRLIYEQLPADWHDFLGLPRRGGISRLPDPPDW
jgi:hypothetical protein